MEWLYLLPIALPLAGVAAFVWMFVTVIDLKRNVARLEARLAAQTVEGVAAMPAQSREAPVPSSKTPPPRDDESGVLERLLGGKLLIWIGGAALVLAAVFLIRYSIEIGLITPAMRMIAAALFGLALIAGGEGARATKRLFDDPRIGQALVGAGLAVLYLAVYGSHWLYGFFGLGTAGVLMVLVTAAALGLSLRHGAAAAGMGLVGGYLTPWLVGDPQAGAWPLLLYIGLLDAAVFAIALRRGWSWIAALAVLATFAWTGVLLVDTAPDALAGAGFALGLGILASFAVPPGIRIGWVQPLVLAGLQATAVVARDDTGPLAWLLLIVAGVAGVALAWRRPHSGWVATALLGLSLAALTADRLMGDGASHAVPAFALLAVFGGGGAASAWLQRRGDTLLTACLGFAGPLLVLRYLEPAFVSNESWGVLLAMAAAGPILLSRRGPEPLPALTGAALLGFAAVDLFPADLLSLAWAALAIGFIAIGIRAGDRSFRLAGLVLLTLAIAKLFLVDAAQLTGALRILSFLAFGAALIVLGRYYGTLLRAGSAAAREMA